MIQYKFCFIKLVVIITGHLGVYLNNIYMYTRGSVGYFATWRPGTSKRWSGDLLQLHGNLLHVKNNRQPMQPCTMLVVLLNFCDLVTWGPKFMRPCDFCCCNRKLSVLQFFRIINVRHYAELRVWVLITLRQPYP